MILRWRTQPDGTQTADGKSCIYTVSKRAFIHEVFVEQRHRKLNTIFKGSFAANERMGKEWCQQWEDNSDPEGQWK